MPSRPIVMVVEDDREMRSLLTAVIRSIGAEVVESGDGAEASALLDRRIANGRRGVPDLLITDVRLPGLTGLEILSRFRQLDRKTPVLVITAFGDQETHAMAGGLGAHVLDKPFDLEELRGAIRRLVPVLAC